MVAKPADNPNPRAELGDLAGEMDGVLRRHVAEAWFPRCIDIENGGFIADFDRRWRRGPSRERMLEFQARQTRVAARLGAAFPADGRWQEYALHGLRFLRDQMWDREHGGWFWITAGSGEPLAGATKHAHSGAYAVQAAALVYQVTGERAALEHAEEGLDWFDRHAHDSEFGGFHNWLTRQGRIIRASAGVPPGTPDVDPMGHAVGLKDVNVHGDWYEALLDLCANSDSIRAGELLREFAEIFLTNATTPAGEVQYAFHPDWTPQPGLEWYGYGFQAAERFLRGAAVLPEFPELAGRAEALFRHALRQAAMPDGGFCHAGPAGPPMLEGHDTRVPVRSWWVQFEALRALAIYAANDPTGSYIRQLSAHWAFIKSRLLDEKYGGIYSVPTNRPQSLRSRLRPNDWDQRKARQWKDASHETACLIGSSGALRASAEA